MEVKRNHAVQNSHRKRTFSPSIPVRTDLYRNMVPWNERPVSYPSFGAVSDGDDTENYQERDEGRPQGSADGSSADLHQQGRGNLAEVISHVEAPVCHCVGICASPLPALSFFFHSRVFVFVITRRPDAWHRFQHRPRDTIF